MEVCLRRLGDLIWYKPVYKTVIVGTKPDVEPVHCQVTAHEMWAFIGLMLASGGLQWAVNDDGVLFGSAVALTCLLVVFNRDSSDG